MPCYTNQEIARRWLQGASHGPRRTAGRTGRSPPGCSACRPARSGTRVSGGVILGQLPPDRHRRLERRSASAACLLPSRLPISLWAGSQAAPKLGDRGVVLGQLPGSPAPPQASPRLRRAPVSLRAPMLLWLAARSLRYSVTVGWSSASLCWIASAARTPPAPPPLPRLAEQDADAVVAGGQVALELGDGGVVVGQPLADRPGFLIEAQCVFLVADLVGQAAQVEGRGGQPGEGLGPGVAVGLELIAEGAEEGQRLLQEALAERLQRRVVLQLRVRRRRRRGTASPRRWPAARGPRRAAAAGRGPRWPASGRSRRSARAAGCRARPPGPRPGPRRPCSPVRMLADPAPGPLGAAARAAPRPARRPASARRRRPAPGARRSGPRAAAPSPSGRSPPAPGRSSGRACRGGGNSPALDRAAGPRRRRRPRTAAWPVRRQ